VQAPSAEGAGGRIAGWLLSLSLVRRLQRYASGQSTPTSTRQRQRLLVLALVAFVALAAMGLRASPVAWQDVSWAPVLVALLAAVPLTFVFRALEFRATAALLGHRVKFWTAAEVAVLASAANMLPIPGSVLVTIRSLSEYGTTRGGATKATASVGLLWVGTACLVSGTAILLGPAPAFGGAVAATGVAVTVSALVLLTRQTDRISAIAAIAAVEVGFSLVDALRFGLLLTALGVPFSLPTALGLSLANVFSVATGIFPSGLGIREAFSAAISPLLKLPAGTGLLVAVIDRVLWLLILAVLAGLTLLMTRSRR
jgi:uncharacterized membrane protein YbhN (UPF0104 family)